MVGCLLSHITVRSYGLNHTHRLCLVPCWLVFTDPSSAIGKSSCTPKLFRLRMYFHIHSPTMVPAIESTRFVSSDGRRELATVGAPPMSMEPFT